MDTTFASEREDKRRQENTREDKRRQEKRREEKRREDKRRQEKTRERKDQGYLIILEMLKKVTHLKKTNQKYLHQRHRFHVKQKKKNINKKKVKKLN